MHGHRSRTSPPCCLAILSLLCSRHCPAHHKEYHTSPIIKPPALSPPSLSSENSCNKCNKHLFITCSSSSDFTERTKAIIQKLLQNLVWFPSVGECVLTAQLDLIASLAYRNCYASLPLWSWTQGPDVHRDLDPTLNWCCPALLTTPPCFLQLM